MILNNFYACMEYLWRVGVVYSPNSERYGAIPGLLNVEGEQQGPYRYWYNSSGGNNMNDGLKVMENHSPLYNLFMQVGTGTTEPTSNDYALTTLFSGTGDSVTITTNNRTDTGWKIKASYTAHNTTSSDVTITEAGIGKRIQIASSIDNNRYLLAKVLLDNPVTIPPGESRTICLDWDLTI